MLTRAPPCRPPACTPPEPGRQEGIMAELGSATTPCCHRAPEGDPLTPVVALIYEAALAPERWPEALMALSEALGGGAADPRAAGVGATPSIPAAYGVEPGAIRSYDPCGGALAPVTAGAGAGAAWGRPAT